MWSLIEIKTSLTFAYKFQYFPDITSLLQAFVFTLDMVIAVTQCDKDTWFSIYNWYAPIHLHFLCNFSDVYMVLAFSASDSD